LAALHTDRACTVDRAHSAEPLAARAVDAQPGRLRDQVQHCGGEPHRVGRNRARLALGDRAAEVFGVHFGCAHRDGAHAVGLRIDLDRHLDAPSVGADPDCGLQRLAADRLQVLRLRMWNDALDHVAH
jgi:hypothetical protein